MAPTPEITRRPRRSLRRRLILCIALAALTTLTVAWTWELFPARWHNCPPSLSAEGIAVSNGLIISVMQFDGTLMSIDQWSIRDTNDGIWNSPQAKNTALLIQQDPVLFHQTESRIDDRAARGIPRSVLDGPPDPGGSTIAVRRYGWPFPALAFTSRMWTEFIGFNEQGLPTDTACRITFRGTIQLPDPRGRGFSGEGKLLPYHIVPLGFVADVISFSAAWGMLLFAPGFVRRHLRSRRGLCPSCGYNLSGSSSPTCPECGSETPAHVRTA